MTDKPLIKAPPESWKNLREWLAPFNAAIVAGATVGSCVIILLTLLGTNLFLGIAGRLVYVAFTIGFSFWLRKNRDQLHIQRFFILATSACIFLLFVLLGLIFIVSKDVLPDWAVQKARYPASPAIILFGDLVAFMVYANMTISKVLTLFLSYTDVVFGEPDDLQTRDKNTSH